jgi:arsenate reductase
MGGRGTLPRPERGTPLFPPKTGAAAANPVVPAKTAGPLAAPAKKHVLFVCIGNSCRSQMAEAFARAYGADIMDAQSAGVSPATIIAPLTRQVLSEKNLKIDDHFPKGLESVSRQPFDVIVNMSGTRLSVPGAQVIEWVVKDPIGQREEVYRTVAAQIEGLVMRLILDLRTASR